MQRIESGLEKGTEEGEKKNERGGKTCENKH
jgi:hypothetical protein